MNKKETLTEIKLKVDIIRLANDYGFELIKYNNRHRAKINLLREETVSSLDFYEDTQKYYDMGTSSGGDAIDLIKQMENLSQSDAISKIKELAGEDIYAVSKQFITPNKIQKKTKTIDFNKLKYISTKELEANATNRPYVYNLIIKHNDSDIIKKQSKKINISKTYEKLFETSTLDIKYKPKIDSLFKYIIGYSDYWESPSIILSDRNSNIVDIVAYRPKDKKTGEEIKGMKYYYKNKKNRGENFIYPFENLVKHIAKREKYIVVGEGLKNSVNALLYSVPFISLESTENIKNISKKLIDAINDFRERGYGFITAFDGDTAGEKAYYKFLSITGFEVENLLSFESNIDFTDYIIGNQNEK